MNKIRFLSGADYFIYALDRNIVSSGLSGNYCVVLLELDGRPSERALREFITGYFTRNSFYNAAFRNFLGRIFYWKDPGVPVIPDLYVHKSDEVSPDGIVGELLSRPLDRSAGEIIRFDLVGCRDRHFLCITTDHVFTDACGIQRFLYSLTAGVTVSCEKDPGSGTDGLSLLGKLKLIRKSLNLIDGFALKAPPISFFTHRSAAARKCAFKTRSFSFSAKDSGEIAGLAARKCGYLNETNYFLLAVLREIDGLYKSSKLDPGSFVFPVMMHLGSRKVDSVNRGNNVTFLYYQVLKSELESGDEAVIASIKKQTLDQLKEQIPAGAYYGLQFMRILSVEMYRKKMYQSMKGEIANFFFSNIGGFRFKDNALAGSKVVNIHHFPAVCASPGIVFTFSKYDDRINYTIVYIDALFSEIEIDTLVSGINRTLLGAALVP